MIDQPDSAENFILAYGGRTRCRRCAAKCKSTQERCRAPAMAGRRVCRLHGGKSTGPRSDEGRSRCAGAKTVHGRETREVRRKRAIALAELRQIEEIGFECGLLEGRRSPGPKPR
ncbi:HGGxSTG domain-containing protein [Haliea sp. E1-2-M8]|uniref:HGGxSTG domain-containing protein n=1 Tax=Haliea sp. E1-2-M8 TaxID=3064706 RepID=UPI00351BF084